MPQVAYADALFCARPRRPISAYAVSSQAHETASPTPRHGCGELRLACCLGIEPNLQTRGLVPGAAEILVFGLRGQLERALRKPSAAHGGIGRRGVQRRQIGSERLRAA
jgi:hypothetical protein